MSKKTCLALAAVVALALPANAFAQIGIGARAGTLGLGGEVSIGVGSMLGIRGGFGVLPNEINTTVEDIDWELNPPSPIWNVGVDLYPFGGGFRIGAGVLNRKQFDVMATEEGSVDVGDNTYNGRVTLEGSLTNERETAPYVVIGYGRTFKRGVGLFIDLGAAAMGEGNIEADGTCTVTSGPATGSSCADAQFQQDVDEEAEKLEDEAGSYINWHPILQIGLKIGF
jgi:hypothetical protein